MALSTNLELGVDSALPSDACVRRTTTATTTTASNETIEQLRAYADKLRYELKTIEPVNHRLPLCVGFLVNRLRQTEEEMRKFDEMNVELVPLLRKSHEDERTTKRIVHRESSSNGLNLKLNDNQKEKIDRDKGKNVMLDEELSLGMSEIKDPKGKAKISYPVINAAPVRKRRRCWSRALHNQFVHALQLLGGPQVATPKQIREYMKVEGLTNDEVKSHLQKYRLHLRDKEARERCLPQWPLDQFTKYEDDGRDIPCVDAIRKTFIGESSTMGSRVDKLASMDQLGESVGRIKF